MKITLIFSLLTFYSYNLFSQEAIKPRPSPTAIVTMKYEDTYLKITYCQPHKKGREIFGSLVAYGEVWRTGANEATELTVTKDIILGGKEVPKGTYSIFTIPNKDSWTIIINTELGLWGSYNYDQSKDLCRFETKTVESKKSYEPFTILFEQKEGKVDLVMVWDTTKIAVPVVFN